MSGVKIKIRKGETIEKALRRLKKALDREEVLVEAKKRRNFISPSAKRQERIKRLRFQDMLRRRDANR